MKEYDDKQKEEKLRSLFLTMVEQYNRRENKNGNSPF